MLKIHLSLGLVAAALGATSAGCKKGPDEALVIFPVQVVSDVMFDSIEFTVEKPPTVPPRTLSNVTERTFQFGYYMPGVTADKVTIVGTARHGGCITGIGRLANVGPVAPGR